MNAETTTPVPAPAKIEKGSTVKWRDGYYRVSAAFKDTVNLAGIFSSAIAAKGVPRSEVTEAHDEWYAKWTESETYKSM